MKSLKEWESDVRCVVFKGAGGNEVVDVQDRPDLEPAREQVVVRASYAALNPADIQQRDGKYPAPFGSPADVPGLEVCGVVERCGAGVSLWKPGDRVFGLVGGGGLADQVAIHERLLARVPEAMSEPEAAATPEAFITAHDAIITQANLRPGETLVVQGGSGGVGSAAIQIAVGMGAAVIGVARSETGRRLVESLGAVAVSSSSEVEHNSADVILELVGAPNMPYDLDSLATCGRIIVVGVGAGAEVGLNLLRLMQKRATVRGTVLRGRPLEEKVSAVRAFEREVLPALTSGRIKSVVDSVFDVEDVTLAFDHMGTSGRTGKVLLRFS